jgi:hypothetical protein
MTAETASAEHFSEDGLFRLLSRILSGAPLRVRVEWARYLDLDAAVVERLSAGAVSRHA